MSSQTNLTIGSTPVFEKLRDKVMSSDAETSSSAPKRIQALFELLRDIQNDGTFREKHGKEQSKEIVKGMQKRLLAARDESASLVFGSGKLGSAAVGTPELSLNQTLTEIERDLLDLRGDHKLESGEPVELASSGTIGEVGKRSRTESSNESASDESETTESSTDGFVAGPGARLLPQQEPQANAAVDRKHDGTGEAADEDLEDLLAKERKRSAHLEYLNKALESKVQTIEAERLKMKQQLASTDGTVKHQDEAVAKTEAGHGNASQNAERKRIAHLEYLNKTLEAKVQTIEAQKQEISARLEKASSTSRNGSESAVSASLEPKSKALEEKLQQSMESLDIFKAEASSLHQEILQLRKQVALSKEEADRNENLASNLRTLNRELEQQLTRMSKDKGLLKTALEKEQSLQKVSTTEHGRLAKSNKKLQEKIKDLQAAHAAEKDSMTRKIQSSENGLSSLRDEVERNRKEREQSMLELEASKDALIREREARDHEIGQLKQTIHEQRVLLQNDKADFEALETELRHIIMQQRTDLKAQSELLGEQKSKPEQMERAFEERLQAISQKHAIEMAKSKEIHSIRMSDQEALMLSKQEELQQLLDNAREVNRKLESRLQKSREDNARCLALVAKLGKQSFVHGGTEMA